MVLNISHEDKKKYKESLKPKNVKVRARRSTLMSDKLKNRAFKKFDNDPKSKSVDEEITIDEHLKMNDNFLRTGGWKETSKVNVFDHLEYYYNKGIRYIKVTDISKEGSLSGPSIKLYEKIMKRFPNFSIYAGGGVRNVDDLNRLSDIGIYGTIIGKAYYEGLSLIHI